MQFTNGTALTIEVEGLATVGPPAGSVEEGKTICFNHRTVWRLILEAQPGGSLKLIAKPQLDAVNTALFDSEHFFGGDRADPDSGAAE